MTTAKIVWTLEEMRTETADHFGWDVADCEVMEARDGDDEPCLVVLHIPTGRDSSEAGDGGRWHMDRTGYR